jgi:predicted nuclease of restriction endonuclease-like (RecB) superfamily
MNFNSLLDTINGAHIRLQESAVKAINKHLTIRNWLIGFYIVEFEQNGEDRAQYGEKLLQRLAESLNKSALSYRSLKLFRQFYLIYPQIGMEIPTQLNILGFNVNQIGQTASAKLQLIDNQFDIIRQTASAQFNPRLQVPPEKLLNRLSFSHLSLLLPIKESLHRTFYEIECIKGTWSVSELKRQIGSLYFERSGMSKNPEKLSKITLDKADKATINDIMKSPFTFEFLGLKAKEVVEETDLEQALIDHMQDFLLELGNGFCFEARQKRILIDDEYCFVDLVFYHRVLKCHVLVDIKVEKFNHAHLSQLNSYVAYYRAEEKLLDDNDPVGILLCTEKGKKLVEYALSGMDEKLFVSKYLLQLPSKKQLTDFIQNELNRLL